MGALRSLLTLGLTLVSQASAISYNVSLTDSEGNELPYTLNYPESSHRNGYSEPSKLSKARRQVTSLNWCGALWTAPPSGTFSSAVGTWVVPTVSEGPGDDPSVQEDFYQWVGIGGWESCGVILQAGTAIFYQNGVPTVAPWWEIYPDPFTSIDGFTVSEGDTVTTSVVVTGAESGTVNINNANTGQNLALQVSSADVGSICTQDAEWILEDPEELPFPSFPSWSMTGCSATTSDGTTVNVDGSTIVSISGKCNAAAVSSSEVSFAHP